MQILDWGTVPYQEASSRQLELVEGLIADEKKEDILVFCSHPPVVTVGRGTRPEDVFGWQGEIIETPRGGRATYHGPSQIVVYPILNLNHKRPNFPARDLHGYMRSLEKTIVETLQKFEVTSEARAARADNESPSLTGVWVGERKVASIGVATKKWITYHGLALNLEKDPKAFSGIRPCGFHSSVMTSMEEVMGGRFPTSASDRQAFRESVKEVLLQTTSFKVFCRS